MQTRTAFVSTFTTFSNICSAHSSSTLSLSRRPQHHHHSLSQSSFRHNSLSSRQTLSTKWTSCSSSSSPSSSSSSSSSPSEKQLENNDDSQPIGEENGAAIPEGNGNDNGNDNDNEPDSILINPLPSDTAIGIDPIKHLPSALIDASGALQIDDGSLTPKAIPILPRKLIRRKDLDVLSDEESISGGGSKKLSIEKIKENLKSGFDTGIGSTILLIGLILLWYWSNTAFNVYNKRILTIFHYPLTVTMIQFFIASVMMSFIYLFRFQLTHLKQQNFRLLFRITLPLSILHAIGFLLTNMSLGKVSVAFTHTVKATEPFFSVALTPSILGDVPTWGILISLFPIVLGVIIASATDVSFNWLGFLAAIGSNLALQSRNILSKRLMNSSSSSNKNNKKNKRKSIIRIEETKQKEEEMKVLEQLDNINLFTIMTILAFLILLPITILYEGFPLVTFLSTTSTASLLSSTTSNFISSSIPMKFKFVRFLIIGGIYRCIDVLASYMILKRVSPVSHSIGNCVKRAIVIFSSVIFFNTKMTMLNILGTTLALFGVLAYSLIVSACKQNSFGLDSPFCRPIYTDEEVELVEGGGI